MEVTMNQKQRIKTMRDMARKLRDVASVNSIGQFSELEDWIKTAERRHRNCCGGSSRYSQSVAVAVDYFLVRTFAHAFQDIREAQTKDEMLRCLQVRTDYLLALGIVARYADRFTSCIHVGELFEASEMIDYCQDIAGN